VTTDGGGNYTLVVPSALTNGATLKVVETNPGGHLSTGAGVGNTGGAYDRSSDTITFTLTSGTTYTGVNFGDVPENSFVADSQQSAMPGLFVLHPHTFVAGSAGDLAFSVTNLPSPALEGWSQVIHRDANGNGTLDTGEAVVTAAIAVNAGDKVSIVVKDCIPAFAPLNAQNQLTVTATLVYGGATPALTNALRRVDLTTVGASSTAGLTLLKAVDKETALPGETITYTITYANQAGDLLREVVIYDETPAFTIFVSATNSALPNSLTNCVITAPAVGASGPLRWTFGGALAPSSSGTVIYRVNVAQ
jgi:uncharacterized repeat protein (TIGR01451 family)